MLAACQMRFNARQHPLAAGAPPAPPGLVRPSEGLHFKHITCRLAPDGEVPVMGRVVIRPGGTACDSVTSQTLLPYFSAPSYPASQVFQSSPRLRPLSSSFSLNFPCFFFFFLFAESLILMQQAAATAGQLFLLSPADQEFSDTFNSLTSQVS